METSETVRAGIEERIRQQEVSKQERNRERVTADLLKMRATREIPEEKTHQDVQRWFAGMGFSEEQLDDIATACVPYVRQRTEVLVDVLKQTSAATSRRWKRASATRCRRTSARMRVPALLRRATPTLANHSTWSCEWFWRVLARTPSWTGPLSWKVLWTHAAP